MRYEYKDGEKLTRFSIRKYHFGAASVAVASLIFFGGGMSAKAENVPVSHDTQNSGNAANASGDSGKQATANNKPITVDVPQAALPTAKVDKADLIIYQCTTFIGSEFMYELMRKFKCPVIIWAIREPSIDGTRLKLNSLTGAFSAGNSVYTQDRDFDFVFGYNF